MRSAAQIRIDAREKTNAFPSPYGENCPVPPETIQNYMIGILSVQLEDAEREMERMKQIIISYEKDAKKWGAK